MSITDEQIEREITGCTQVVAKFKTKERDLNFNIFSQEDNRFFCQYTMFGDPFCAAWEISKAKYDAVRGLFTDEQQFCTDPEVIRPTMTSDEFADRYLY